MCACGLCIFRMMDCYCASTTKAQVRVAMVQPMNELHERWPSNRREISELDSCGVLALGRPWLMIKYAFYVKNICLKYLWSVHYLYYWYYYFIEWLILFISQIDILAIRASIHFTSTNEFPDNVHYTLLNSIRFNSIQNPHSISKANNDTNLITECTYLKIIQL